MRGRTTPLTVHRDSHDLRTADRDETGFLVPADGDALQARLSRFESAQTLADQADAFLDLAGWVLLPPEENEPGVTVRRPRGGRFRAFVEVLENDPRVRRGFVASFGRLLAQSSATNLFGEAGLPGRRSFFSEAGDRLAGKLVPTPRNDGDLAELLRRLIPSEKEFRRLQRIPPDLFHRFVESLAADQHDVWASLERDFADGCRLLALWVQSLGLGSRVRSRSGVPVVSDSPFHRLGVSTGRLLAAWQRRRRLAPMLGSWRRDVAACRLGASDVHRHLEAQGVNVEIVFALEIIERSLTRLEFMAEIIARPHGPERSAAIQQLLARLVYFAYHDRRLRHLVDWNLSLLNRKIVERSGRTGEHYIARTPKEYLRVWMASAGGGALTVFTAAIKLAIVGSGLALFQEGFAAGLNYAVSFLLLQAFDLMLATKQPAMTAASLAAIVRDHRGSDRDREVAAFTARICYSQLASAVGNVVVVFAGGFIFDRGWELVFGVPFLEHAKAQRVFETLSPVNSGTVFYAALTGVLLWMASVCGGWFDNFTVYNQIPQGIADHRLGRFLGRERMARLGGFVARNAAGWGTNVSLGFLLGFTPAIGSFLGIPMDVRHVTLSSGMLAIAAASMDTTVFSWGWFFWGVAGVGTMFVLNLSVSFILSLNNAAQAYGYTTREVVRLLGTLVRWFIQHPLSFILPPRNRSATSASVRM